MTSIDRSILFNKEFNSVGDLTDYFDLIEKIPPARQNPEHKFLCEYFRRRHEVIRAVIQTMRLITPEQIYKLDDKEELTPEVKKLTTEFREWYKCQIKT